MAAFASGLGSKTECLTPTKRLKKGDVVVVNSGSEKGKQGTITLIDRKHGVAMVEGLNIKTKHQKATQAGPGGKTTVQAGIRFDKLSLWDATNSKASRKRVAEPASAAPKAKKTAKKAAKA